VRKETYGAAHQCNWKKTGLSRAHFKDVLVQEAEMPTARAVAAFRFLMENNEYYRLFRGLQARLLERRPPKLNVSSYDLFIVHHGIECAMFPVLYPTTDFTDTGIMAHYQAHHDDQTSRVVSIAYSWTRKVS